MKEPKHPTGMVIPHHRLPPGFTDSIGREVTEPVAPRPAATVALLRDAQSGPEALLLLRQRRTGFVPGAYVFPGGRVDPADGDERLGGRVAGLAAADPPRSAWVAAARELFEETGVLLARTEDGSPLPDPQQHAGLLAARQALLEDRTTLCDVLAANSLQLDLARVVYFAHWITPVVEPKRFDTRFFLAALPPGQQAAHDAREMDDAVWLTPAHALARFHDGTLPMVFPTVHSLELIDGYETVAEILEAFRGCRVRTVLPRLAHGPDGVELIVDPEDS
jgi:8-oxo-dGTP pyrophosphatase MutT (NUDIX family)